MRVDSVLMTDAEANCARFIIGVIDDLPPVKRGRIIATTTTLLGPAPPVAKPCRPRKPSARVAPPGGLLTSAQVAAKLGCSIKTLNGHVASGALRYVAIGHGTKRPRKMFTDSDLDAFIANQTRKDSPCPSSAIRARHIGASTSSSKVIAFSAVPRPRPGGKRKQ
jgi:hypothetical protein